MTLQHPMDKGYISSIEIDLGGARDRSHTSENKLSFDEITDLVTQAAKLGARTIILRSNLLLSPEASDIIAFINVNIINDNINNSNINNSKDIEIQSVTATQNCAMEKCASENGTAINCKKVHDTCFVGRDGIVYPCEGLLLAIGNIRKRSLKNILTDSEVIQNIRNHTQMIKGPCRGCEDFTDCCGCRGRAYNLTGDYLASDPICPKNQNKGDKITHLPMSAKGLIPQKLGMRVVTTLVKVGERYGQVESVFSTDSPFIKKDKSIEEMAYMEIMAQSAAAMHGFEKFDTGAKNHGGFLIGGQKINIYIKAFAGEKLITDIYKTTKFGNFGVLTATIKRGDEMIAEGEIKIYGNDGATHAL